MTREIEDKVDELHALLVSMTFRSTRQRILNAEHRCDEIRALLKAGNDATKNGAASAEEVGPPNGSGCEAHPIGVAYIGFYEREFYPLSNFSSFMIAWDFQLWPTLEHAYHAEKFTDASIQSNIRACRSAHEAFKYARAHEHLYRPDWYEIRLDVMRKLLRAKVNQHPYVKKKLLETGDYLLVEDSWRDDFWGWGTNKDGQNWLGRLWMEVRDELTDKGAVATTESQPAKATTEEDPVFVQGDGETQPEKHEGKA